MRSNEHTKNELLNNIIVLENQLSSQQIDNFNVVRRKVNSRIKTLGKMYLTESNEFDLQKYHDKLKGKLNEVTNTTSEVT